MTNKTLGVILGGGVGSRLYPLTEDRSKPAVPIAGKYRLIDIPISNCLNSGIKKMIVLTQFNSASLNKHIKNTYHFDIFSSGFVDIFAAEQTRGNMQWFQGTADAVRQCLPRLKTIEYDYILVLSGDQLYQMDLKKFVQFHIDKKSDLTVATIPVNAKDASGFGIMKVNNDSYIDDFVEKPTSDEIEKWKSALPEEYTKEGKHYLASMGIYVFSKKILKELFEKNDGAVDFGKEIIPYAVVSDEYTVGSYPYSGYWTDIGSISSFYDANLSLTDYLPAFNLYSNTNQVYTRPRMLSPAKIFGAKLNHVLVAGGSIIHAKEINKSIVGVRSRIGKNTIINSTILMGNDYYQTLAAIEDRTSTLSLLGIGDNCIIEGAIIDKNVKIGNNVIIKGGSGLPDSETEEYCIREGIIIVKKGATIKDNAKIGLK